LFIAPTLAWLEETSGHPAERQSIEFKLAADAELVKERLYGAINIFYEPERTQLRGENEAEKEARFGVSSALALQISKGVFTGGEIRHVRQYESFGLGQEAGHATFIGPAFCAKLSEHWWIAAAWLGQVAGRSVPALSLDLDHFSHHEVRLKAGFDF
jgi:hypothetical protein